MAQMESKWIDNRSFEQITLETVPTDKYQEVFNMIKENPKLFNTDSMIIDVEMAETRKEITNLKDKVLTLNLRIEKIKNPSKKKNNEEAQESANVASLLDQLDGVIAEKQQTLVSMKDLEKKLELLQIERDYTVKKWISFNRLIKEYNKTKDDEYLAKGVHWISEYADKMIEREKKYYATHNS